MQPLNGKLRSLASSCFSSFVSATLLTCQDRYSSSLHQQKFYFIVLSYVACFTEFFRTVSKYYHESVQQQLFIVPKSPASSHLTILPHCPNICLTIRFSSACSLSLAIFTPLSSNFSSPCQAGSVSGSNPLERAPSALGTSLRRRRQEPTEPTSRGGSSPAAPLPPRRRCHVGRTRPVHSTETNSGWLLYPTLWLLYL